MKLIILGAGGLARTLADVIARTDSYDAVGFCDDATEAGTAIGSLPVLGATDELPRIATRSGVEGAVVAVGNPAVRAALAAKAREAGLALPTIIDPTAVVSPSLAAGEGVVIGGGAVVGPDVRIDRLAIIGAGAVIEHDAVIEQACYVGPRCLIDARARISAGATVAEGRCVAQDAVEPER